jgi:manganese/zinc/iron transport system permease protein
MMTLLAELADAHLLMVCLGVMLIGGGAAIVGTFTFVRKRALLGDAIAHAVLPGVVVAFIVTGDKHPFWLLLGAVGSGLLSLWYMDFITNNSKIKPDAAIGAVLSLFFGLGILLLTAIQGRGDAQQAGLDKFLFGKAASLSRQDVMVFAGTTLLVIGVTLVLFRRYVAVAFDREYALSTGMPVKLLEFSLSVLTVLTVATGIQAVGVVLMAALLITPAAAARFWTNRMGMLTALSALFGIVAALGGALISYTAPGMPTGPWIVVLLSLIALISVLVAPEQGILARHRLNRMNVRKIQQENMLKAFYMAAERSGRDTFTALELREIRDFEGVDTGKILRQLQRKGLLNKPSALEWQLSAAGTLESRRVVRLHRLWELYLSHRMGMEDDHIHDSAEAMEHLLTPAVEQQLLEELSYPLKDPHDSPIPYDTNQTSP